MAKQVESFHVSKHFLAAEYLPPTQHALVMKEKTDEAKLAKFFTYMDKRVIEYMERIRTRFGSQITINNWHIGGTYTLRGWRPKNCPVGAKDSMHKKGMAVDYDVQGSTANSIRQNIKDDQKLFYSLGLRRVESQVSWNHNDIKDTGAENVNKIIFFNP